MPNITRFPGAPALVTEPVSECVRALEDMLALAKEGHIRAVAIASVNGDDTISSLYHTENEAFQLIGATQYLVSRMTNGVDD